MLHFLFISVLAFAFIMLSIGLIAIPFALFNEGEKNRAAGVAIAGLFSGAVWLALAGLLFGL